MLEFNYRAYRAIEMPDGIILTGIASLNTNSLGAGEVLIKVLYSSLNYKDALSASGHKGITRKYPHTPGIDAAGIVADSISPDFRIGDEVIVTGYDLGMNTNGGFGEYILVPASWVAPKPNGLSLKESMILGTAGFTAGLCLFEFHRRGLSPDMGKVLVTGASGGVGSISIAILAKLGYQVAAATGKQNKIDFLRMLGCSEALSREEIIDNPGRPLLERKWAAAIDNVGGPTLSYCIKSTDYWGTVACVGLVASDKLEATVYPFLLRGVGLVGIDSADRPMNQRLDIWNKLANEWKPDMLNDICKEIELEQIDEEVKKILVGQQFGRVVIRHRN